MASHKDDVSFHEAVGYIRHGITPRRVETAYTRRRERVFEEELGLPKYTVNRLAAHWGIGRANRNRKKKRSQSSQ